jgi:hypothetical protein
VVLESDAANPAVSTHQAWTTSLSGQDHWSQYPLNRVKSIRSWQDCRKRVAQRHDSMPAPSRLSTQMGGELSAPSTEHIDSRPPPVHLSDHETATAAHTRKKSRSPPERGSSNSFYERRYSQETREAGEALFSIRASSQSHRLETRGPLSTWAPSQSSDRATPTIASGPMISPFPAHLFW